MIKKVKDIVFMKESTEVKCWRVSIPLFLCFLLCLIVGKKMWVLCLVGLFLFIMYFIIPKLVLNYYLSRAKEIADAKDNFDAKKSYLEKKKISIGKTIDRLFDISYALVIGAVVSVGVGYESFKESNLWKLLNDNKDDNGNGVNYEVYIFGAKDHFTILLVVSCFIFLVYCHFSSLSIMNKFEEEIEKITCEDS
ncbi:hypothetical protein [Enterococcus sp. AZ109]|uniref:hypothetical protein n=1 Tax=Enterococcus sp. AZ109 TaxID=2774634 RepID=UPI003F22597C